MYIFSTAGLINFKKLYIVIGRDIKTPEKTAIDKYKTNGAWGEAAKIMQAAEAYKQRVVAASEGEASRFVSIYNEYAKAKKVTKDRMYLETMEKVLADIEKVIIDKNSGSGVVPYLPLPELNKKKVTN